MEPLLRALVKHDNITMGTKQQLTASSVATMDKVIYYETDTGRKKTGNGTSTYAQLAYDSGFGLDSSLTLTLYGNGTAGDVVAFRIPGIIERVTLASANAARWVGILRTGGSDGQDVIVDVFGSVNDKLSNLNAGSNYYLNTDGTLTTQVTSYFVGRALTDKALIVMNSGTGSLNSTNPPNRPSNVSPLNNATGVSVYPTLTASVFSSSNDTHDKSRWQISTSSSFATIAYDSGEVSDLISHAVPNTSGLLSNTTYYWRVAYKGTNGGWSDWSLATSYQSGSNTDDFIFVTPGVTTWTVPPGMFFGDSAVIPDQSASSFATFLSGTSTAVVPEFQNVTGNNFPNQATLNLSGAMSCSDNTQFIYYATFGSGPKLYKYDTITGAIANLGNITGVANIDSIHYLNPNTLVFVVQGTVGSGIQGRIVIWSLTTMTSINEVAMPNKCIGSPATFSADKTMLYIFGGYGNDGTTLQSSVYRVSGFSGTLAVANTQDLVYPQANGVAVLVTQDNYALIIGGTGAVNGSTLSDRIHVYNLTNGTFISSNVLQYHVQGTALKAFYHSASQKAFIIGSKFSKETQSSITDVSRDYVSTLDLSGNYAQGDIQQPWRYQNYLKIQTTSLYNQNKHLGTLAAINDDAYLLATDNHTNVVYKFTLVTTAIWNTKPVNNLEYYSNHGLVIDSNDNLYAIGGLNGLSQSSTKMTRRLAGSDIWDYRAEMDTPRSGITPVRKNNKIHVVGGYNTLTSNPIASMEIYDIALNSWANGPAFPATIHEYGSDVDADGDQWIVGGIFNNAPNNTAYYLDSTTLQWIPASWGATNPVISGIYAHAITIIGSFMYIIGGNVNNVGVSARLIRAEIYLNTTTGKKDLRNFTNLADMPVQLRSFALAVDKVAGKFNVIGGDNASGNTNYHFEYTVSSNNWKSITSFPIPIRDMAAVRDSAGKIITVGGNGSSGATASVAYVFEFNGIGYDFAGEDEIAQGQGFTFNDPDLIATPGPYGTSSKIAGIRRSIPLTPGDVHQLTIGSPAGGIRIKKSQQTGPSGQAEYTTAGTVTFTVPNLVNFIHALIIPNVAAARLGTLLTSVAISSSVNTQVNTYTTSQTVNVPAGATNIRLIGKGGAGQPSYVIPGTPPTVVPAQYISSGTIYTYSITGVGNQTPNPPNTYYVIGDNPAYQTDQNQPPWTVTTYTWQAEYTTGGTPDQTVPATTGTSATAVINGQTYTFSGGIGGPATNTTFNIPVVNGNITSMQLTIPSGGQIVAEVIVNATTSNTYLSNTTVTIPAGVTQVKFTGKGADGSPGVNNDWSLSSLSVIDSFNNRSISSLSHTLPGQIPVSSWYPGTPYMISGNVSGVMGPMPEIGYNDPTPFSVNVSEGYISATPTLGDQVSTSGGIITVSASWSGGGSTPGTTGSSATATLNGQTYTFAGGNGTTAQSTTFTVNLSGATALQLQMVIPSGAQIVVETTSSAWAPVANMSAGRSLHASTCDNSGKVYVFGGVDSTDAYLTTAEVYDPDIGSWTAIAAMPQARTKFKAIYDGNDAIYLIGGENSTGKLSSVVKYTISSNSYSTAASLDIPLCNYGGARDPITGFIYIVGGETNTATAVNNIRRFKPALNQWEDQTWINNHSITTPKAQHDVAYSNGALYIYGGVDASNTLTNTGYKYVISSESVTPMTTTNATAARSFTLSADRQNRLYRVGGYSGSSALLTVDIYNPDDDAWAPASSIPETRQFHSSATDSLGRIYIIGGNTSSASKSNSVIRYTPSNCFDFTNENGSTSGNGFNISGNLTSPGSYGITSRQAAWRNNIPVTSGDQIQVEVPAGGAVKIIWGSGKFFPDNAVV